jgi:uncharacterized protein (DUF1499 family)
VERAVTVKIRGNGVRFAWLLAAGLVLAGTSALSGGSATEVSGMPNDDTRFLDFSALERPGSPNHWLVAPADSLPRAEPDVVAPELPLAAPQLAEQWIAVVEAQPRTRVVAVSDDGLQVEAEQRSAVFRFVDRVSFRAVPLADGNSSFMAYSRSLLGYYDFGVNRRRLGDWVDGLTAAAGGR